MYSVILMAAFTAAPEAPAGILFHRRSAGCTGTVQQVYAAVPVRGCTGGFAAAPAVYAPVVVAPAAGPVAVVPAVKVPRTPVRTAAAAVVPKYVTICENGVCRRVRVN
jgi:hypothetical protein